MVPGVPTMPRIHVHLLLVLPQPFTACTQILYPDEPIKVPYSAYTVLELVTNGPLLKGPVGLVLNFTTDELLPVFHENCMF